MSRMNKIINGYVAVAVIVSIGFIGYASVNVYDIYKNKNKKVEYVKKVNVNCVDGSRWKNVSVTYLHNAYDLYEDTWIARVPSNMCSLVKVD